MSIGSKIKDLCEDHDISQRRLSREICLSRGSIYNYTNDFCIPNAEILHDIAKYFGVKMEYFFDDQILLAVS